MNSPRRVSTTVLLLSLLIMLCIEFTLRSEIKDLEPTRTGIFRMEVCVLGLILAGFVAEEIVGLSSTIGRELKHRFATAGYLLVAFAASVVIYQCLMYVMNLPAKP